MGLVKTKSKTSLGWDINCLTHYDEENGPKCWLAVTIPTGALACGETEKEAVERAVRIYLNREQRGNLAYQLMIADMDKKHSKKTDLVIVTMLVFALMLFIALFPVTMKWLTNGF